MTDFSTINVEPFCTPLDIRLKHRRFTPAIISDWELWDYCVQAKSFILMFLQKYYSESNLKETAPWGSSIVSDAVWEDFDEVYDNIETSLAIDANERAGFRGISLPSTNVGVFTQHYTINFTSDTAYDLNAFVEGAQGSGTTISNFTSSNGDVTIPSDSDYGTFKKDNRFHFSVYVWYRQIVMLAKFLATGIAMVDRYGDDQEDAQKTARSYISTAAGFLKKLNNPDNKDGLRLPSLGAREPQTIAYPYDVDFLGRDMTKILTSNQDKDGNKGEQFGVFSTFFDDDSFFGI